MQAEKEGYLSREAAAEQGATDMHSRLLEAQRRAVGAEAAVAAEHERSRRLREEVETLMRTLADARKKGGEAEERARASHSDQS